MSNSIDILVNSSDRTLSFLDLTTNFFIDCNWGILAVFFFIILFMASFSSIRTFMTRHLKSIASLILIAGIYLYGVGFNYMGSKGETFTLFFRSLLSSLEMFTSRSSLIGVDPQCKSNSLYMLLFSITHFMAVFVSAFFIIKLFGYRVYSWFSVHGLLIQWKLHKFTHIFFSRKVAKRRDLFVLWGVNNKSVTLAESIIKHFGKEKVLIVFVITPGDSKNKITASRFSFSNFFHLSSDTVTNYIDRIEKIEAILMNSDHVVNTSILQGVTNNTKFYQRMSLKALGKLVYHFTLANRKITYYLLSEDENENIEAVNTFKKIDRVFKDDTYHNNKNFHIYCHARRNYFNTQILMSEGLEYKVTLIDSSMLAIRELQKERTCQPVNFVDIDFTTGEVLSTYECLIIGFGEIGRDALRFLYEFSAFVGKGGNESMRHFHIVDKNIQNTRSLFLYSAPALKNSKEIDWWENCSTHNDVFWKKLKDVINRINCIMVCVDNDDEAKQIVGRLYDFVYRNRENQNKFTINVHISNSLNEVQVENFNEGVRNNIIHTFGSVTKIFDYNVLASEQQENEAKKFYYRYQMIANEFNKRDYENDISNEKDEGPLIKYNHMCKLLNLDNRLIKNEEKYESLWNYRRKFVDPVIDYDKNDKAFLLSDITRIHNEDFIEIHYKEAQDKSNAWHRETKCTLAGIYDKKIKNDSMRIERLQSLISMAKEDWTYIIEKKNSLSDAKLIYNLDVCEHLRWNAKMEIMGFVYAPFPNKPENIDNRHKKHLWKEENRLLTLRRRTHKCLMNFSELCKDPDISYTVRYDQGVVQLSFILMLEDIQKTHTSKTNEVR